MEIYRKNSDKHCNEIKQGDKDDFTVQELNLLRQYRSLCEESKLTIDILVQRLVSQEKGERLSD